MWKKGERRIGLFLYRWCCRHGLAQSSCLSMLSTGDGACVLLVCNSCANDACANDACANDACANDACANDACANDACANDACANDAYANDACANDACADGAFVVLVYLYSRTLPTECELCKRFTYQFTEQQKSIQSLKYVPDTAYANLAKTLCLNGFIRAVLCLAKR